MDNFLSQLKFNDQNEVPRTIIKSDIAYSLNEFIAQNYTNAKPCIVCDENTQKFIDILPHNITENAIITKLYKPDSIIGLSKRLDSSSADFYIALGSGTINDLVKYSASRQKKDYICIATALSMNGYVSANSSLKSEENTTKTSYQAQVPKAVFIDLDIVKEAPKKLTLAGFADMACMQTLKLDWLLEDFVCRTLNKTSDYNNLLLQEVWSIFSNIYDNPLGLNNGDGQAYIALAQALLASGHAMTVAGSSKPASMGEHILAHELEQYFPKDSLHGQHIAVTSRIMHNLQTNIVNKISSNEFSFKSITYKDQFFTKNISQEEADLLNSNIAELKGILIQNKPDSNFIEKLDLLNLPKYQDFGIGESAIKQVIHSAKQQRDRLSFLDLVEDIS